MSNSCFGAVGVAVWFLFVGAVADMTDATLTVWLQDLL